MLSSRCFIVLGLIGGAALMAALLGSCGPDGASQPTTKQTTATTTTTIPSTTGGTTTSVSTSSANGQGDYVALLPDGHTRVALSTDGQQVIAYASNGDGFNPPTFASWFVGPVDANGGVDLNSPRDDSRLLATLSPPDATGNITLQDGTTLAFTALPLSSADNTLGSGLYRSEATFEGVPYLAGWIVDKPEPGEFPVSGGAILDELRGELITVPQLTEDDISAMQVTTTVPLGTFPLAKCHLGTCS